MTEDSAHVVFPETPEEEEEGEQGMPREVDISWMAEHAKQVLRLLPSPSASWWPTTAHALDLSAA